MERRGFISMLGAFFGALVFGGKIPEVNAKTHPKPVSLFKCPVAGFQYYHGPSIYSGLNSLLKKSLPSRLFKNSKGKKQKKFKIAAYLGYVRV